MKIRYYGRYVDDFILVYQDNDCLKELIPVIKAHLQDGLQLTLHPNKIHLQHYSKGVQLITGGLAGGLAGGFGGIGTASTVGTTLGGGVLGAAGESMVSDKVLVEGVSIV